METYEKAMAGAFEEAEKKVIANEEAVKDAQTKYDEAYKAWLDATADKKSETLSSLKAAKSALELAQKNNISFASILEKLKSDAYADYLDAIGSAGLQSGVALVMKNASIDRDKVLAEVSAEMVKLEKIHAEAITAGDAAVETVEEKFEVFAENAKETATGGYSSGETMTAAMLPDGVTFVVEAAWNGGTNPKSVTIEALTALNKEGLADAIATMSQSLYGDRYTSRLVAVPEDSIKAEVNKLIEAGIEEAGGYGEGENGSIVINNVEIDDVLDAYDEFGVYGKLLGLQYEKNLKQQIIDNPTMFQNIVKALQENLDELVATKEAAEKAADDAYAAWYAATVKYDEGDKAASDLLAAQDLLAAYRAVLFEYQDAVNEYIEAGEDGKTFYADLREAYVAKTKTAVAKAETKLYDAETALMTAENNLKNYKSGDETKYEQAKKDLDEAQAAYTAATETYEAALKALNDKIAAITVE